MRNAIFGPRFIGFTVLFLCWFNVKAQLRVDTTISVETLVNDYFLTGTVKEFHIEYQGARVAIGAFSDESGSFNIRKGIIITTGMASMAQGPNNSKCSGIDLGQYDKPDKDLVRIADGPLWDQAILEF